MGDRQRLVTTAAEFVHIIDYLASGIKDHTWFSSLAAEAGWVVITSDGGTQSKRGEKLPDLLWDAGVTHVILRAFSESFLRHRL